MKGLSGPNLHLALVHYPVTNKNGDVIASAVTNLDLHDIARAARTYGVKSFYVVTPLEDQIALVGQLVSHWVSGSGSAYNPKRRQALELIRIKRNLEEVISEISALPESTGAPRTIVTSAVIKRPVVTFSGLRRMFGDGFPYLLVFGTAWGLAEAMITSADIALEPIRGTGRYNHLSVRSAAAVILDRLLGHRDAAYESVSNSSGGQSD